MDWTLSSAYGPRASSGSHHQVVQPRFRSAITIPWLWRRCMLAQRVFSPRPRFRIAGDPPTDIVQNAWRVSVYAGVGNDCPSGCLHHHYWEFRGHGRCGLRCFDRRRPTLSAKSDELRPRPITRSSAVDGAWVTATLEPDLPATPEEIDIASIRLNGIVPVDPSAPSSIGDVTVTATRPDGEVRSHGR